MTTAEVTSALAGRKTVRVTYSRSAENYRVDLRLGEKIIIIIATGIDTEKRAEGRAAIAAALHEVDITRRDVS